MRMFQKVGEMKLNEMQPSKAIQISKVYVLRKSLWLNNLVFGSRLHPDTIDPAWNHYTDILREVIISSILIKPDD